MYDPNRISPIARMLAAASLFLLAPYFDSPLAADPESQKKGMGPWWVAARTGVLAVETRPAMIYGLSLRGDIRVGRGPWAVTLNGTLTFGGGEPFEIRTDPAVGYYSTGVSFHPLTFTVGFMRWF